ncbi:MAG: hypothetical protein R6W75_10350 [Smithellaceae bacterium]
MPKINKIILMLFMCVLAICLWGCGYAQKQLDIMGLKDLSTEITVGDHAGTPEKLRAFVHATRFAKDTQPAADIHFTLSPLAKWQIEHPSGDKLITEKITFPSGIRHQNGMDTAVFYVYRTGELKDKKVILWVPGAGVSDFAFRFIKYFFMTALARNYNIVFYVPPYHLERTQAGKGNGVGMLTPDHERNISGLLNVVKELRTIISYLKSSGVTKIGGWGGSIGATMLLLTEQTEEFDHLSMMIPVIDFDTVIFRNKHMRHAVVQFEKAGFSENLLDQAYGIVNPMTYQLKVDPNRVQIMYAQYDQLTPESAVMVFAQKNHIEKLRGYPRSHATMLLTKKIYRDYDLFLDSLDRKE